MLLFKLILLLITQTALAESFEGDYTVRIDASGGTNIVQVGEKQVAKLAKDESVVAGVWNRDKDVLVMVCNFVRNIDTKDSARTGYWYSRLLIVRKSARGNIVAKNALVYNDPFMKTQQFEFMKLIGVSETGREITARIGRPVDGMMKYEIYTLRIDPPEVLGTKKD